MIVYAMVEGQKDLRIYEFDDTKFDEADSIEDRIAIARNTVSDELLSETSIARRVFAVINGNKK